ncbi:MAG: ABC transporter related [Deltaproteobacteria bacterium]|nr:ABC transporter related [Deltaproteobacteria bacterium]
MITCLLSQGTTVVEGVLELMDLQSKRNVTVDSLSRGMQQRLGIARVLIHDPKVLILDEPTVGLDPKQIIEIRKLIKNLAGKRTIILSTHILPEVSMTCNRVVIINKGKVVAVDTPQNLTANIHGASRLIVKVDGPTQDVITGLQKIQGINKVNKKESSNGISEFILDTEKGIDIRRDIAAGIVRSGWGLLELRPVEMSLEDIFIKLVTKE